MVQGTRNRSRRLVGIAVAMIVGGAVGIVAPWEPPRAADPPIISAVKTVFYADPAETHLRYAEELFSAAVHPPHYDGSFRLARQSVSEAQHLLIQQGRTDEAVQLGAFLEEATPDPPVAGEGPTEDDGPGIVEWRTHVHHHLVEVAAEIGVDLR